LTLLTNCSPDGLSPDTMRFTYRLLMLSKTVE
jgi:hypothetical protein